MPTSFQSLLGHRLRPPQALDVGAAHTDVDDPHAVAVHHLHDLGDVLEDVGVDVDLRDLLEGRGRPGEPHRGRRDPEQHGTQHVPVDHISS